MVVRLNKLIIYCVLFGIAILFWGITITFKKEKGNCIQQTSETRVVQTGHQSFVLDPKDLPIPQDMTLPITSTADPPLKFTKNELKNIKHITQFLSHMDAFLIDISILGKANVDAGTIQYPFTLKSNIQYWTYGIFKDSLEKLIKNAQGVKDIYNMLPYYEINCTVHQENGLLINVAVITTVYLNCSSSIIQLSVFYQRGDFYWIGKDKNNKLSNWFGDLDRAVQKFETTVYSDSYSNIIWCPLNLKKFLYDYKYSKFLECNRELADQILKKMPNYTQNTAKNKLILPSLKYLTTILENLNKPYWLHSGTLLGWYRDCGILPHVNDVDVAMLSTDYDDRIHKLFLGNSHIHILMTIGIPTDGYELRMFNGYFGFDLFFFYPVNSTHMWCGYHGAQRKYISLFKKITEICSADVLGIKFLVPCDARTVLSDNYGSTEHWREPKTKNYNFGSVDIKRFELWSNETWPYVKRQYNKYGNINRPATLQMLNSSQNNSYIMKILDDES